MSQSSQASQSDVFLSRELDGTLEAFISSARPAPVPVATSQEIRDRGSIFVATIYSVTTPQEAAARVNHVKHVVHRARKATHEISAWRCMVLKPGKTGLNAKEDFEVVQGSKDDGESWAGGKVLKVMQDHGILDAVVIVTRWYGGTMLGPARFSHIETCAAEVCKEFKRTEELHDCITTLRTLDALLADHRAQLAALTDTGASKAADAGPEAERNTKIKEPSIPSSTSTKTPEYKDLDLPKARRLIQARERAINSVRAIIAKKSNPQAT